MGRRADARLAEHVLELTDRAPVGTRSDRGADPGLGGSSAPLARAGAASATEPRSSRSGRSRTRRQSELLTGLVGDELDTATRIGLIREAEGNPLYLEELARAFLEGALEPRGRTWTVTIGSLELLPPSLENLLVARIDRQADGPRRLAQIAAAIGRTLPGLGARARVSGESVGEALKALLRAEIVREVSRYPELECTFTHGLLREAALSTLTSTRKRALYAEHRGGVRGDLRGRRSTSTSSGSPTTTRRRATFRRRSSTRSGRAAVSQR